MRGRRNSLAVLVLALLVAAAFLFRRTPGEQKPQRPAPRREAITASEPPSPAPSPAVKPAARAEAPPPSAAVQGPPGTVRGLVRISGEIPPRKKARIDHEPDCAAKHAEVVLYDNLVADSNGNVQWAFVQVKSGPIGTPPPAPTTPVLLDQIRCVFTPHMVGVRVGQPIRVLSSDDLLHNVHGLPFENKEFNIGLPQAGMEVVRSFDKPEVFPIKCDVHPWMRAFVGVVEHPYFSITNELGAFVIRDLPPGKFRIEAWHEMYRPVTRVVDVPPGGDVALDFVLDAKRD